MPYQGVIIEESLEKPDVLDKVKILETKIEEVTEEHKTPHLKQWTLHTVEVSDDQADKIAEEISGVLNTANGHWYADFKNEQSHYVIFRNKVYKLDRTDKAGYDEITKYGIALGIPDYQLDFSPEIK